MSLFDYKTFLRVAGGSGDLFDAVESSFGVPKCLMNLTRDLLDAIPSNIIGGMRDALKKGRDAADDVVKSIFNDLRLGLGIIEWSTEAGGFVFISRGSKNRQDKSQSSLLEDITGLIGGAAGFLGRLYTNYELAANQIEYIKNCIKGYRDQLKYSNGNSAPELAKLSEEEFDEFINTNYLAEKKAVEETTQFIEKCDKIIADMNAVLAARQKDPSLEPQFNPSALNILSGTSYANSIKEKQLQASSATEQEIIRLIYGPPRSTGGNFLLSNDGIYYNSQTASGILPVLTYLDSKKSNIVNGEKWRFNFAPNLGGKGDQFSIKDLDLYFNTILDPEKIEDGFWIQEYYDKDKFLREIESNKSKRIYDLSSQINEMQLEGKPQAIIFNLKQALTSEVSLFNQKINKRKKQIELAVKLPQLTLNPDVPVYFPGEIPVNDFSYLSKVNFAMDIQKQKSMSFSQDDVSSVVLPIKLPTLTLAKKSDKVESLEHLYITDYADGAIIYDGSSINSVQAPILAAESFITTDSIIGMYNFLDTNIVTEPSSTEFTLRNSMAKTNENFAQLVTNDLDYVYRAGLGIVYLNGITESYTFQNGPLTGKVFASALGSYIRLPQVNQYTDLLYNTRGATIDFWVHVPNLLSVDGGYNTGNVSSLFRIILGNENTGVKINPTVEKIDASFNDFGDQTTRGLLMGFTRDRRLTSNLSATNEDIENDVDDSVFFIAPTQALSFSSVGFINRSYYDSNSCVSSNIYHGVKVKLLDHINNLSMSSIEKEFCHVAVSFDREKDLISIYLDGNLITASSMSYSFGIEPYTMPNIPSFKNSNSFEYAASTISNLSPEKLKNGPKLDEFFTPWIVGGGYTDGMIYYGNFMGGNYGGSISGLRGYLGSLKFYSKSLSSEEILNNYKAHKGFFKNIDTFYLGWEQVISS